MKSFADQVREFVQAGDGNRRALAAACGTDTRTVDRWGLGLEAPARHDQVVACLAKMIP